MGSTEAFMPDGSYTLHTGRWGPASGHYTLEKSAVCVTVYTYKKCRWIIVDDSKNTFWLYSNGDRLTVSSINLDN
jgi:hypothetical protein